ncbi:MAG TPA: methyl-accepting chemotaxis protein [Gammaproteobacteria bacterium]
MKFLQNVSLKYQVWGGLMATMLLLLIIAVTSIYRLNALQSQATETTQINQPTMLAALKLQNTLNKTNSDLGLFMVNRSDEYATTYRQSLQNVATDLNHLDQLTRQLDEPELAQQIKQLTGLVKEYNKLHNTLDSLTINFIDNYPAMRLANETINPIYKEISQSFSLMIDSEFEEGISQQRQKLLKQLIEIEVNWHLIANNLRVFLANPSEDRINEVKPYVELQLKLIDELGAFKSRFTFEQEEGFGLVKNRTATYIKTVENIFNVFLEGKWRRDSEIIKNDFAPLMKNISAIVNQIIQYKTSLVASDNQNIIDKIEQTRAFLTFIVIFALIIGLIVAITSSKQVTTIISEIQSSLKTLSSGDFSKRYDENRLGETGRIAVMINAFSDQLSDMIRNMHRSVDELKHASSEVSTATEQTASIIIQQHHETEQVATAVEEMTATAQEIAQNASLAADSAKHADEHSKAAALVSSEAMGGINHLVNDLNNASNVIKKLQQESNNISVVLDVIRDISEQTNLLALNAAIEAARAGEQGRGFAVVADEVRTLASRTQESTNQIRNLIEVLQSGASDAVNAMNNAIKEVNLNSEQVENVAEALGSIAGDIGNINNMLDQMAAASEQQSATSVEISRNIVSISSLSEQTSQSSEHLKSAETGLNNVTGNINSIIAKFRI